jgi:fibronectin-binding autotransporter adhesin
VSRPTPRVSAAWQHAFGDVTPAAALTFQTLGTSFNIARVPLARDAAVVDAGFDVRVTPQITFALSYFGKLASHVEDHSVKGSFAYRF